jgi:hypothetical protein
MVGGVLSILSGVVLVLYFAKLDTLVEEKYYRIFGVSNTEIEENYSKGYSVRQIKGIRTALLYMIFRVRSKDPKITTGSG